MIGNALITRKLVIVPCADSRCKLLHLDLVHVHARLDAAHGIMRPAVILVFLLPLADVADRLQREGVGVRPEGIKRLFDFVHGVSDVLAALPVRAVVIAVAHADVGGIDGLRPQLVKEVVVCRSLAFRVAPATRKLPDSRVAVFENGIEAAHEDGVTV